MLLESELRVHIEGCVEFVVAAPHLLFPLAEAVQVDLAEVRIVCWLLDLESSCLVECVEPFLVPDGADGGEGAPDAALVTHKQQPSQSS